MGLMTETPWEAAVSVNSYSNSNVDYHRENLKQLKKMQQLAKMKKEAESNKPLKAFPTALTEANKKKFDHVQSKVQEWVVSTNGGRESSVKNYLKGHARTGPFLDENDSAIRIKRLSGLKANTMSSKDKLQVIKSNKSCKVLILCIPYNRRKLFFKKALGDYFYISTLRYYYI